MHETYSHTVCTWGVGLCLFRGSYVREFDELFNNYSLKSGLNNFSIYTRSDLIKIRKRKPFRKVRFD